jgi:hypothetical protein
LKYGIDVKKVGRRKIIELTKGSEVVEKFKVIEFRQQRVDNNSRKIKVLKLKRI